MEAESNIIVETYASRAGFSGENIVKHSPSAAVDMASLMFAEPEELWVDPRVLHIPRNGAASTKLCLCAFYKYWRQVLEMLTQIYFFLLCRLVTM